MFYVYEWYDEDTKEIIYVGKGTNNRYKCKQHNKLFKKYIETHKCNSRIVKYFNIETEAFKYEKLYMQELKDNGYCICNIYKGGFGGDTKSWTPEKRKYYSLNNCMKQQQQRERMSVDNPMKNPKIAKVVGIKHRKPLYIGNDYFETLEDAAGFYKVTPQAIYYGLRVGKFRNKPCYRK